MLEFFTTAFLSTAAICMALLVIILLILRHKSSLIFGIYPQKSLFYHLKYVIALLVLKRLRYKFYHKNEKNLNTKELMENLDKPQVLSDNPKSYDFVSFMGANIKGQKLMISLERRRRGINRVCLYLWLPDFGLLSLPKLPDMMYFTTNGEEESTEFKGNGFHIYPKDSMKLWCIKYEGKLQQTKEEKSLIDVKMDLEFSATSAHFDYNRDLSPSVIADSIAREAWNENFYMLLKSVDKILEKRTHYEQSGCITGEIQIDKKHTTFLETNGFRDHSFGTERCLSTINRYVYFALFLEDGTSMIVGNLSQPSFFLSSLKVGYICSKNGIYKPITKCNFELYSYGEKGTPPNHQNFIVYTHEDKHFVQIKVEDSAVRYVGGNWESKVFSQFVSCTVNGIQGQGIAEYLYRHHGGRPVEVCATDPEWYQRIRKFERSLSNCENTEDSEVFFF